MCENKIYLSIVESLSLICLFSLNHYCSATGIFNLFGLRCYRKGAYLEFTYIRTYLVSTCWHLVSVQGFLSTVCMILTCSSFHQSFDPLDCELFVVVVLLVDVACSLCLSAVALYGDVEKSHYSPDFCFE